jgi:hypothetical protein
MTMREELIRDMDNMEEAMMRTADRCDIWQDRVIYAMCKAIYDLLKWAVKMEDKK